MGQTTYAGLKFENKPNLMLDRNLEDTVAMEVKDGTDDPAPGEATPFPCIGTDIPELKELENKVEMETAPDGRTPDTRAPRPRLRPPPWSSLRASGLLMTRRYWL